MFINLGSNLVCSVNRAPMIIDGKIILTESSEKRSRSAKSKAISPRTPENVVKLPFSSMGSQYSSNN
jgi:hypothetical protein